jgi:uncharacterized protein YegL
MNKSLIFLLDVSASMLEDGKDTALYNAMGRLKDEVFPDIHPPEDVRLTVRILAFGGENVTWVCGDQEDGVFYRDFNWDTVKSKMPQFAGRTPLGKAVAEVVNTLYYGDSVADFDQAAPAIIIISDGMPTDNYVEEFQKAKNRKAGEERQGLFSRSLRTAIGIGLGTNDEGRQGRAMLESFGRLSKTLKEQGLKTYYDVSDNDLSQLVTIVMSLTQGFSEAAVVDDEEPIWST